MTIHAVKENSEWRVVSGARRFEAALDTQGFVTALDMTTGMTVELTRKADGRIVAIEEVDTS